MELTMDNSTRVGYTFYWDISFPSYTIQSIKANVNRDMFYVNYNNVVQQYLESDRTDECPLIFTGNFNLYFYEYGSYPYIPIEDVQSIQINIIPV